MFIYKYTYKHSTEMRQLFLYAGLISALGSHEFSYTEGWTGTLTIKTSEEVNITQHMLALSLPPSVKIHSAWGGVPASIQVIEKEGTHYLKFSRNWQGNDCILPANKTITLSFSPSQESFDLKNIQFTALTAKDSPAPQTHESLKDISPTQRPTSETPEQKEQKISPSSLKDEDTPTPSISDTKPKKEKTTDTKKPDPALPPSVDGITFTPYVDITLGTVTAWSQEYNNMAPILLESMLEKAGVRAIRMAFITEDATGNLQWGGYPLTFPQKIVEKLESKGYKISLSLGGAIGTFPGENNTSIGDIKKKLLHIRNLYPNSDFCFDIETPSMQSNTAQLKKIMTAFKEIQNEYNTPLVITLPVLPEGLALGVNAVKAAHDADVNFKVNLMAMDYGSNYQNQSMFEYAVMAAENTAQHLRTLKRFQNLTLDEALKMVELTPMIGYNDTLPLVFTLKDMKNLVQWAKTKGVHLSYWSLTRDFPRANSADTGNQVSALHSGVENQTQEFEFAKIFTQN